MNTVLERKIHPQHFSPPHMRNYSVLAPSLEVRSHDIRAMAIGHYGNSLEKATPLIPMVY